MVPGDSSPETPYSEDGSWFSKPIVDKFLIYALKRKLYIEMLPAPDFPEHDASIQADLSRQHAQPLGAKPLPVVSYIGGKFSLSLLTPSLRESSLLISYICSIDPTVIP